MLHPYISILLVCPFSLDLKAGERRDGVDEDGTEEEGGGMDDGGEADPGDVLECGNEVCMVQVR